MATVAALAGGTVSSVVVADVATVAAAAKAETETNIDSMSSAFTFLNNSETDARSSRISEQRNHDSISFINNHVHGYVPFPVQPFENHLEIPSDLLEYDSSDVEIDSFSDASSTISFDTI